MDVSSEILTDVCFFIAQECDAAAYRMEGREQEIQDMKAEFWYQQALRLAPHNPEIHYAMSYATARRGDFAKAILHCTEAMKSRHPEHAIVSHYNRALLKLMLNDYAGGFEDYEARLEFPLNKELRRKRFGDLPYWRGEPCKTLIVTGEQGFGDIFQFCRYVPLIKDFFPVEKIFFEVPESMHALMRYNFRNQREIEVISGQENPAVDYHIQVVSLAHLFGTKLVTVPPIHLNAEALYIEKWRPKDRSKLLVAFNYSARKSDADMQVLEWNRRREIDPEQFMKIFTGLPVLAVPMQPELNPDLKTWSDTAGMLANMDLVISIDSGPVHLAAALGVPTWLLNHQKTCWRWQLSGEHTPWYGDNLTILRQGKDVKWEPVIIEANRRLRELILKREAA